LGKVRKKKKEKKRKKDQGVEKGGEGEREGEAQAPVAWVINSICFRFFHYAREKRGKKGVSPADKKRGGERGEEEGRW